MNTTEYDSDPAVEHKWQIPLPWRQRAYSLSHDCYRSGWVVVLIAWRVEWGCFFLRIGRIHWWDDA